MNKPRNYYTHVYYLQDCENLSGREERGSTVPSLFMSLFDPSLLHKPSELPTSTSDGNISTSMTLTS